jgi:zinc protease
MFAFLAAIVSVGAAARSSPGKLVLLPDAADPTISLRFLFRVGSQDDPKGKEGLAALTAAMLTGGATKKRSYEEILRLLYPMAAGIEGHVDKEMTVISGRTHKDNLAAYHDLFLEVIREPAFEKDDFMRLQTNAINFLETSLRYADDEELGKAALGEFVFAGTPYGHLHLGHVASLKAITLEDVKAFYKRHYTPANLTIGIAGGYGGEFAKRVQREVRKLPAGKRGAVPRIRPEPIEGLQIEIIEKDADATAITFGFPIDVVRGSTDIFALAVANSWLGEHRNHSSRLYQVIREARGLTYGAYSYIEFFPDAGRFMVPPPNVARRRPAFQVWIRPVPNSARIFAFRAALRELQQLVDNGLQWEQFDLTRRFLENYSLNYAPTNMMKLGYAMDDVFYGIPGHYLERFRERMGSLTLEEVNAAIKKHLQYKNLKVVFVTNEAQQLKDALVANTPSPITYPTPKPQHVLDEDKAISVYPISVKPENVSIRPVETLFQ